MNSQTLYEQCIHRITELQNELDEQESLLLRVLDSQRSEYATNQNQFSDLNTSSSV